MESAMTSLQPFFGWLLQTTLIGSVVIGLILAAQKVLGGKLGPRWGHALWLVLVVRLLLPGAFPGQIDLLDLVASRDRQVEQQQPSDAAKQLELSQTARISSGTEAKPVQSPESGAGIQNPVTPRSGTLATGQSESKSMLSNLRRVLPFLWLAGALVIGFYLLWSNFFLWRIVKRDRPLLDQKTLELFEECKELMGVQTLVGLVPSSRIKSPALFGFVRPRLLLPLAMVEEAGQEEMRYVFLHELAHLKHRDIYLGWLTSLLQILHWFNPLVWFAFHRMRADRELSCDAYVLSRTGNEKSQEYGRAIVGLLRRFSRSRPLPAMAGILENQSQLKRRITMIAQFKRGSYRWSPLSVIVILALGVVSLSFTVRSENQNTFLPKSEPGISLRRIETGPMSDFSGSPSLDGRYICDFQSTSNVETAEMVIRDLTTGEIRPLTKVSRQGMWYPVISPASTQVAYMDQFGSQVTELQLINVDGTGHRSLRRFENGEEFYPLAWTPDGKQILGGSLGKEGENLRLVAIAVEDGSMREIHTFVTDKPAWNSEMAISWDGRYLAFERPQEKDSEARDIYILDIEGQQTECVVQHAANDRLLGWTPDDKYILFASDRKEGYPSGFSISNTWDAYILPVADGAGQGAPELVKRDIPAKIRPKGFTRDGAFYYAVEFSTMEVAVAEVDMQTGKQLKRSQTVGQTGTDVAPAWSPDGRYLAYGIQKPDNSQTICVRNMETGQERIIDPKLPHFLTLRWSPDGKFLLGSTFKQKSPQAIYRIDSSTGERVDLVQSESAMLGVAQLSRDGRTLFYVLHHPDSKKSSLMSRDMESGREKEFFSIENASNAQSFNFALSPDGRQLALAIWEIKFSPKTMTFNHRILTMPAEGGEPKELLKNGELRQYPTIAWTPDGQSLLFTNSIAEGGRGNAVFCVPAGGGQARELCRPQTMMYGHLWSVLDVNPDGRRIAFDCFEYRHEVWAMENFLSPAASSKDK
jgi:beta-lactamase regulating signal transducer with metallopeptidase domain/Tol biopolymer transport system component